MSLKRIRRELEELNAAPSKHFSVYLPDPGDATHWLAKLKGPPDSLYADGEFSLSIDLSGGYPLAAPRLRFLTPIYHPNVDRPGQICLDLLQDKWSPAITISKVVESISYVLSNPMPEEPLNQDIADQMRRDPIGFEANAKEWTRRFAKETQNVLEEGEAEGSRPK